MGTNTLGGCKSVLPVGLFQLEASNSLSVWTFSVVLYLPLHCGLHVHIFVRNSCSFLFIDRNLNVKPPPTQRRLLVILWFCQDLLFGWYHRDRCGVCALERERARSRSKAVLCGDACIHTHEGQLLEFNKGLNGNF